MPRPLPAVASLLLRLSDISEDLSTEYFLHIILSEVINLPLIDSRSDVSRTLIHAERSLQLYFVLQTVTPDQLVELIDPEKDSLRFYYLGNKYQTKIEHVGAKPTYEPEGFLAL